MLARTPPKSRISALLDELVAMMPPFPLGAPLPDKRTGQYHDAPCSTPQDRADALHHTPTCLCGYAMGEHFRAEARAK